MNFKFLNTNQNQVLLEKSIIKFFGYETSSKFLQELMFLGFEYALQYSFSLNLENFKSYFYLAPLLKKNNLKYTYLWSYSSNMLKLFNINQKSNQSFIKFFEFINTYKSINPISNSLHFIINSGAKANWSQLLQLIGFRGYISNINGYLYEIPIMQNFSRGLNLYEYFISCYGSRKGIIDTAIKTADSGYLTRRLIEVSKNIIIKEYNCGSKTSISYNKIIDIKGNILLNNSYLKGKLLKKGINFDLNIIYKSNKYLYIQEFLIPKITNLKLNLGGVYNWISGRTICNNCFGQNYNQYNNQLGESIGVLAAQTIGEPGTQLTLRTFHTGGVFTKINNNFKYKQESIFNKYNSKITLNMKILSFKKIFSTNLGLSYKHKRTNNIISFKTPGILKNYNNYHKYLNFYNIKQIVNLKFNYLTYNNTNIYNSNQLFSTYFLDKYNILLKKNYMLSQNLLFKNSVEIINNKLIILLTKNKLNQWILKTLNNDIIFYKNLKTIYLNENSKIIKNFNNLYWNLLTIKQSFLLKFANLRFNSNFNIFNINYKLKYTNYNLYNITNKVKNKINLALLNNI
uniref:DNA-directed RNA polymerase n=1 Tax=Nephromyces sp. ex Molgula occidentalis TaxID=2544991 RepID=A0A5C1H7Q8_9APIC|nr:plastid-encoded DNA-directed RNA polymerase beta''A [Nephromyces sp. ex Molgula occidentalis]